mmetsp:Transcript_53409/g.148520  ORF Transcript_53409/g.148520 Transcript_53409/m.148520 type:complete len:202 (+) Transcript_53409:6479-7084(+)
MVRVELALANLGVVPRPTVGGEECSRGPAAQQLRRDRLPRWLRRLEDPRRDLKLHRALVDQVLCLAFPRMHELDGRESIHAVLGHRLRQRVDVPRLGFGRLAFRRKNLPELGSPRPRRAAEVRLRVPFHSVDAHLRLVQRGECPVVRWQCHLRLEIHAELRLAIFVHLGLCFELAPQDGQHDVRAPLLLILWFRRVRGFRQ